MRTIEEVVEMLEHHRGITFMRPDGGWFNGNHMLYRGYYCGIPEHYHPYGYFDRDSAYNHAVICQERARNNLK